MADPPPRPSEPSPAETSGLRGARLAARVRQALYSLSAGELATVHEGMRQAATARHMEYFHDGRIEPIRVLPCPITLLPEQLLYLHSVTRTLHHALLRLPELYFGDPAVRAKLESNGFVVVASKSTDYTAFVNSEVERWATVIKTGGIKSE